MSESSKGPYFITVPNPNEPLGVEAKMVKYPRVFNRSLHAVCRGGMAGAEAARAKKVPITLAPIPGSKS
jgi:hypothetical protein